MIEKTSWKLKVFCNENVFKKVQANIQLYCDEMALYSSENRYGSAEGLELTNRADCLIVHLYL